MDLSSGGDVWSRRAMSNLTNASCIHIVDEENPALPDNIWDRWHPDFFDKRDDLTYKPVQTNIHQHDHL